MSNAEPVRVPNKTADSQDFKKEINLFGGVCVVGGVMIGSGIFYLGSFVMERANYSIGVSLLCWLLGGLISIFGGVCFAELGGMMPKTGGLTVYLNQTYHPVVGYVYGFSQWILASPGAVAAISIAIPTAFLGLIPGMGDAHVKAIGIFLVVGLTLYNIIGVKEVSILTNITMIAKLIPLFIIIIGALFMGGESPNLSLIPVGSAGQSVGAASFIGIVALSTIATLWAYAGWSNIANIAEEIKNPKKNLPWSMIIGISGVTVVYVLFNFAIYKVIPQVEARALIEGGNYYLGTEVAVRLFGNAGGIIVLAGMLVSMLGALNAFILVFSRIAYAMAKEGHFFRNHAKLSKRGIPYMPLLTQAAISIIMIIFQTLEQLMTMVVFLGMIGSVLGVAAVIVCRKRFPDMERTYKVWGYPTTVIITIILFIMLMINNFIEEPIISIIGLFVVPAVGLLIYLYYDKKNKKKESINNKHQAHNAIMRNHNAQP